MKVIVIGKNLKYRVYGINKGLSFVASPGQALDLPDEIAEKEISAGNVRVPLEEERSKKSSVRIEPNTEYEEENEEEDKDKEEGEEKVEDKPKKKKKKKKKKFKKEE